jgi:hypothetical protein
MILLALIVGIFMGIGITGMFSGKAYSKGFNKGMDFGYEERIRDERFFREFKDAYIGEGE